jgi:glucoamylase
LTVEKGAVSPTNGNPKPGPIIPFSVSDLMSELEGSTSAPGAPGIPPTWTSSAKDLVGGSLGPARLWFSLGYGIVNEVYYPRVDLPQIRDLGFIVADDQAFWVEVKRLGDYLLELPGPGIPAAKLVHRHPRFTLTLRITPDPLRDVLLIEITLEGDDSLRPYALLAPHLGGSGYDNRATVGRYRGRRMLWAEQGPYALALAAADLSQRDCWGRASAGYVGASDGWQDFARNQAMRWQYPEAGPGNIALLGELPRISTLALGFGSSLTSAATLAVSALTQPFEKAWHDQIDDWQRWHAGCNHRPKANLPGALHDQLLTSAMVLRAHKDQTHPGAMVASLSVPWGNSRDDRGGYHLVWPRDLVECAGALLALGADQDALEVLRYLIATQHQDGHWYQNQWLGGTPYWQGVQLDEAAFPVILAALLNERGALAGTVVADMVRRALGFIIRTGPASDQDRWEEDAGVNTFTLAACIAALVAGSELLAAEDRALSLAVADDWNARLDDWTAVRDSALARRCGVAGYYVREAPAQTLIDERALQQHLPIKNHIQDPGLAADEQVATDFLQLVRFGLRRADDPLIRNSVAVADALLKVDTPAGPAWRRYNGDGYGERTDGTAFDGAGIGRPWPLLTGERGHYALVAGNDPLPYLQAMATMASGGGMLPEQVWDGDPLPNLGLFPGRPSGSAMPLAWAHAEFIKLVVSRELARPCDCPLAVWQRYRGRRPQPSVSIWSRLAPVSWFLIGTSLLMILPEAGVIHWTISGWREVMETPTRRSGLGLNTAELPTQQLRDGEPVDFTFRSDGGTWSRIDHQLRARMVSA